MKNGRSKNNKNFFQFTTTRPVAIIMIVVGILVFGWLSYQQLALTLMPDITHPSLTIRSEISDYAPEEIESSISRPIEEALGVVSDLVKISSISKTGQADVILEFHWNTDIDRAMGEVREKLDRIQLPKDAEKPIILKTDPSLDPIFRLALSGAVDPFFGRYVAKVTIKRALETVKGVAAVKVKGGYEEEIRVELDEQKISLMGLNIQDIRQRLVQENINLAGGELKEGQSQYIVRTVNEFRDIDEIADLRLSAGPRRDIKLSDIARVYRTHKERLLITRLSRKGNNGALEKTAEGQESVVLEVYKEGDANIVEVARNVREKIFGTAVQQAYVKKMQLAEQNPQTAEKKPAAASDDPKKKKQRRFLEERLKQQMTDFIACNLPEEMNVEVLSDQSVFIENAINEVKKTALIGGILAVLILFLFLGNVASTMIVSLAIPISVVVTFAPMHLFSVSLNIMSLGGLALGIGMLVDNSIVVIESIYRCREEGDGIINAVIRGTGEVGSAVTASTLTTIAVFLPMVFVKGVAGQIFGDLALTVIFSLLASLGVALFFIPMLAARRLELKKAYIGEKGNPKAIFTTWNSIRQLKGSLKMFRKRFARAPENIRQVLKIVYPIWWIYLVARLVCYLVFEFLGKGLFAILMAVVILLRAIKFLWNKFLFPFAQIFIEKFNIALKKLTVQYLRLLEWALHHKSAVLMSSIIPFGIWVCIVFPYLGSELVPEVHQGAFYVELTLPVGTPVERTIEKIIPVEKNLLNDPEVEKVSTVAGRDVTQISDSESGEHTAKITVTLKKTGNMQKAEERVLKRIRKQLSGLSGISYKISRPVLFSSKTPVEVEIQGYNLAELNQFNREVIEALKAVPGLTDIKSTLQRGNPEVQIHYKRERLMHYGLNVMTVANIIRNKVRGDVATQFKKEDRRIDILVKLRDSDKSSLKRLERLVINPGSGQPISLGSVADVHIKEGPSEIRRIDQERVALILANISGRDLSSVSADIWQVLEGLETPEGIRCRITGQNEERAVSLGSLQLALLLAIFMVYIVMASQFESFVDPLVILFTVPFALIGVVLVLWIFRIPLNIMVFLGLIMLTGIVVNNAIVLVDYINQLRRKGMPLYEAIKLAGQARLRPILMTTTTTVLGLFPMALGLGDGAEIRTPMAVTVIAGLLSATVLTLIVIPTVYALAQKILNGDEGAEAQSASESHLLQKD